MSWLAIIVWVIKLASGAENPNMIAAAWTSSPVSRQVSRYVCPFNRMSLVSKLVNEVMVLVNWWLLSWMVFV